MAVSDRSFSSQARVATWRVEGETSQDSIRGAGKTPGRAPFKVSSLALGNHVYGPCVFQKYPVTTGQLTIACNGLSALQQVKMRTLVESTVAHFNILSAIWHLCNQIPIDLHFRHIKNHQDNGIPTAFT